MNLLYGMTAYPPSTGGAQTHLHEIAKRMQANHTVQVMTHWNENRTDWLRGVTMDAPGSSVYHQDGLPVHQINFSTDDKKTISPWAWMYYAFMKTSVHHLSEILFEKFDKTFPEIDLIHVGRIGREFLAWAAYKLARQRGIPFVLTPFHHPRWTGWRYREYIRLYQAADALMALTHAEKKILTGLGVAEEKIHVIGHAPVLPEKKAQPGYFGPGGPVVLFLGQKYAYKGIDQLVKSMPLVWQKDPSVRFAFIGPRTNYSKKLFQSINDPRVIEKEKVSEAEKAAALLDCTIFCLPSSQESFGGVYTEAWMVEKPVVGRTIPAVSELISDGTDGMLVDGTPDLLGRKLVTLIQDADLRKQMGRAGREKVEQQFNWERIVENQENVYKTLVC